MTKNLTLLVHRIFSIFLFIGLAIWSCESSDIASEGYFKSELNDRIATYSIKNTTEEDAVKRHAVQTMHTNGRMTCVYYFYEDSKIPRSGLSSANGILEANRIIDAFSSGIKYAYIKNHQGKMKFVDCEKNPDDDLCNNLSK